MLIFLEMMNGALILILYSYFLHKCFRLKKPGRSIELITFLSVLIISMAAQGGKSNLMNMLISFACFFIMTLIYRVSWADRLMVITVMSSSGFLCDFVAYVTTGLLFPEKSANLMMYMPAWFTGHIIHLTLVFLSLNLGICIFKEYDEYSEYQPPYLRFIMLFVPIAYLVIGNAVFYSEQSDLWHTAEASWPVIAALTFLYCLLFFFYQTLLRYGKWRAEQMVFGRMGEYYRMEISLIQQHQENVRIMKHDMKNHLISIKSLIEQEKYEESEAYIDEMIPELRMANAVHSGNVMIDGILNSKIYLGTQRGIPIHTDISMPPDLKLNHTSITIILGNLLDNALDACGKLPADKRNIHIKMSWQHHVLTFEIANTYMGELRKNGEQILSDRKEEGHGMGLTSVSRAVNQNSGEFKIRCDETRPDGIKIFRVRVMLYTAV